jgi:hypothetical protein
VYVEREGEVLWTVWRHRSLANAYYSHRTSIFVFQVTSSRTGHTGHTNLLLLHLKNNIIITNFIQHITKILHWSAWNALTCQGLYVLYSLFTYVSPAVLLRKSNWITLNKFNDLLISQTLNIKFSMRFR